MKIVFSIAFLLIVVVTLSAQTTMTWTVDGTTRQAIVYAPAPTTIAAIKHPLIFAFHGHVRIGVGDDCDVKIRLPQAATQPASQAS